MTLPALQDAEAQQLVGQVEAVQTRLSLGLVYLEAPLAQRPLQLLHLHLLLLQLLHLHLSLPLLQQHQHALVLVLVLGLLLTEYAVVQ